MARLEVVNEFIYLGVQLESWAERGGGEYENEREALRATDKVLMKIPNMNVKVLQNIYEKICVSKMLYGIEL
jgi:hypothetical protein